MASAQSEIFKLIGGQHGTAVGLRQQAAVVADDHWQVGLQAATYLQFGLGYLRLGGKVDTGEVAYRAAIVFKREHGARAAAIPCISRVGAVGIRAPAGPGKSVPTQAYRTLGVTSDEP